MPQSAAFIEIAETFSRLDSWEERYRYIVRLGEELPKLTVAEKTDANRIPGCVSQVWLVPIAQERNGQVCIEYRGESDAMIVQGLIAVLLAIYSGRSALEVAQTDALALLGILGLREHLTAQRSNGLIAIVSQIRSFAQSLTT